MRYYPKVKNKKYTMPNYTNSEKYQKCWTCAKACGGCPWADNFEPVPGWKAEKTRLLFGNEYVESYRILDCPLYKFG